MHGLPLLYILLGALFIGLGWPLARGKVKPNLWYGFRVPATVKDPAMWYPVNAQTGRDMEWVGAAIIAAALLLLFWPKIGEEVYVLALTAVMIAGILWMTVRGLFLVRKLQGR